MKYRVDNNGFYISSYNDNYVNENYTFITEDLPNPNNFYKTKWDGSAWIEGATLGEIDLKENEIVINEIKEKYEFHKANGWEAYNTFRAKVVNDIYKGLITEEEAFYIEENLSVAFDQISATGDWKTARYKLLQVMPYPEFVQSYFDLAMNVINDYINNNFEN